MELKDVDSNGETFVIGHGRLSQVALTFLSEAVLRCALSIKTEKDDALDFQGSQFISTQFGYKVVSNNLVRTLKSTLLLRVKVFKGGR